MLQWIYDGHWNSDICICMYVYMSREGEKAEKYTEKYSHVAGSLAVPSDCSRANVRGAIGQLLQPLSSDFAALKSLFPHILFCQVDSRAWDCCCFLWCLWPCCRLLSLLRGTLKTTVGMQQAHVADVLHRCEDLANSCLTLHLLTRNSPVVPGKEAGSTTSSTHKSRNKQGGLLSFQQHCQYTGQNRDHYYPPKSTK